MSTGWCEPDRDRLPVRTATIITVRPEAIRSRRTSVRARAAAEVSTGTSTRSAGAPGLAKAVAATRWYRGNCGSSAPTT